jgi:hypothetical protein
VSGLLAGLPLQSGDGSGTPRLMVVRLWSRQRNNTFLPFCNGISVYRLQHTVLKKGYPNQKEKAATFIILMVCDNAWSREQFPTHLRGILPSPTRIRDQQGHPKRLYAHTRLHGVIKQRTRFKSLPERRTHTLHCFFFVSVSPLLTN